MSQPGLSLDEEVQSPDLFSDPEAVNSPESHIFDESNSTSLHLCESEPMDDEPEWKGISMEEIYKGLGPFGCQQHPPIRPSELHTVLFRLPLGNRGPPRSYPSHVVDQWNVGYVRMPNSSHSLYPVEQANSTREFRLRWEVIQEKLLQSFVSSSQLEAAILSYNNKYAERWNFCALHHFFTNVVEEEEANYFFTKLLPKIIQLALQLPTLVTGAIPLLKRHTNRCISFTQLQVASLLANAFLCTFPRRNSTNPQSEYAGYPDVNFNRLFSCYKEDKVDRSNAVSEKLKCIFHYFRRVTAKAPEGTITIQRHYIPKEECPKWDRLVDRIPLLHVTSKGTIEAEGAGLLQVDFANKFVGGGVLKWGCVQEEIRFVICPELIVAMLVAEALDDTEALIVSGIECYSKYNGYSNDFTWAGNYVDETPRDDSGRRKTSIVAIDALRFNQPKTQFSKENMLRELNKAYVGFSSTEISQENLPAIATGNWGCGAFRGNPKLKVLLQLMAAAVAGRSMVYFTFGDTNLRDEVADMYWHLVQRNVNVAQLFSLLSQYETASPSMRADFYRFLYKRSRIKPITTYFTSTTKHSEPVVTNCNKEKGEQDTQESTRRSFLLRGSMATEKEKYEETRIMSMLEKSMTTDLEKTVDLDNAEKNEALVNYNVETTVETKKEIINNDGEETERTNKSLWDVLRDRESKLITSSRKTGLDHIAKTEINDSSIKLPRTNKNLTLIRNSTEDAKTVENKYALEDVPSSSLIDNDRTKKNNLDRKKNQAKILEFFPRKIL